MKDLNRIFVVLLMLGIMLSFSQCSSAQKLQEKAPTAFGEVYCENWVAGVQGGGAGTNIFIPVEDTSIVLDSVYFRGKAVKLQTKPQNTKVFIGYFTSDFNAPKPDMVMSADTKEEYGNKLPKKETKIPFELKDNACVVSYKDGTTTKYFKIENVVEKASIPRPSAPRIRNK